jgi:hypothetical protein
MDDIAERFLGLIHGLEEITHAVTTEQAHADFDEVVLQVFWQRWPDLSSWTGSLWRMLSEELAQPASPHLDHELDELGGNG